MLQRVMSATCMHCHIHQPAPPTPLLHCLTLVSHPTPRHPRAALQVLVANVAAFFWGAYVSYIMRPKVATA